MCDVPTRVEETIAIAALVQAIVVKLHKLYTKNMGFRLYRRALIEENKWRAARWGLDGRLIDFGKKAEVPMRDLALELLEFVDDVVDELGSREHVEYVHTILCEGTSADRQLRVYRETNDLQGRRRSTSCRKRGRAALTASGAGCAGLAKAVGRAEVRRWRHGKNGHANGGGVAVRARVLVSAGVHPCSERRGQERGRHGGDGVARRHEDGRARRYASSSIASRTRSSTTGRF